MVSSYPVASILSGLGVQHHPLAFSYESYWVVPEALPSLVSTASGDVVRIPPRLGLGPFMVCFFLRASSSLREAPVLMDASFLPCGSRMAPFRVWSILGPLFHQRHQGLWHLPGLDYGLGPPLVWLPSCSGHQRFGALRVWTSVWAHFGSGTSDPFRILAPFALVHFWSSLKWLGLPRFGAFAGLVMSAAGLASFGSGWVSPGPILA